MSLNKLSYFGDFAACLIALVWLALVTLTSVDAPGLICWVGALIAGIVLWTLTEYLVHRWIYHKIPIIRTYHEAHHLEPRALLGTPVGLGIVVIFMVVYLPIKPFSLALASGLTSGTLLGYFGYMLVHHAVHHWPVTRGTYLYRMRLRHSAHHFSADAGNYGVTTALWDFAFGTSIEGKRSSVRVG
jgi:sterol desaturase/sphingolipid hydroxylase (fatty acid hydroxylase superfamily)